jgi:retron-type reverse transcriptase
MKRHGNLFEKITDINNIILAHRNARKGKLKYEMVKMVDSDILGYCTKLQKMLVDKTYTTSKYHIFNIVDRGKEREICDLPYYPDRIVHWAIMQILEPIFMNHFIKHTYAALPGRGTHKALTKLREYMSDKENVTYCMKLDIKKFFPNANGQILKDLLRKKIKCPDTLHLLDDIVDSYDNGLPIGNYTSQYFGNYYLSAFDHWLKEQKGIRYYLRYMDDIIILHSSKEFLHQLRVDMDEYLKTNLKLNIKDNWQVFPTFVRGVDFVGYRCFEHYILVRRQTKKNLKAAMKRIAKKLSFGGEMTLTDRSCVGSYKGILKWCDSYRLSQSTINKIRRLQ